MAEIKLCPEDASALEGKKIIGEFFTTKNSIGIKMTCPWVLTAEGFDLPEAFKSLNYQITKRILEGGTADTKDTTI